MLIIAIIIVLILILIPNIRYIRNTNVFKKIYKFFNKFLFLKSFLQSLEIAGILVSLIGLIFSFQDSQQASIQTERAIKLSEDANEFSKRSSSESKLLSEKNIEILDSISKSSRTLTNGIDSFSLKIQNINKLLFELTKNLNSIDKLSSSQLRNLATIDNSLKMQLRIIQNQDSINQSFLKKKPHIIFFLNCDSKLKNYTIKARNTGNIEASLYYSFKLFEPISSSKEIGVNQEIPILEFSGDYLTGDSLKVEIEFSYLSKNGYSNNSRTEYIKCN